MVTPVATFNHLDNNETFPPPPPNDTDEFELWLQKYFPQLAELEWNADFVKLLTSMVLVIVWFMYLTYYNGRLLGTF